jgi:stage V sporulation protein AC
MNKKQYQELVKNHQPKETRWQNALVAFVIGGIIGMIGQFLIEAYGNLFSISNKDAAVFMIITLVFLACLFTAFGFFDKWVTFAKAGLIIPITGFAHSMMSAGIEYRKEGPIYGIGSNVFKLAGSVILYGVVSAWTFGVIRLLIMGG